MEDSPLWNIFSTLSAWERQEFKKFIDSPVYNKSADVKTLFSILTNYIKQIKTPSSVLKIESLTREELYKLVYGENTIYNSNKLSDIMSALITCIEEYFIYKELNNNLLEKEIKLCRALRKRGLNRRFEKTLEDSRQKLEKQPLRNAQYHWLLYQMYFEEHEYKHLIDEKKYNALSLNEALGHLNSYIATEVLQHNSFLKSYYNRSEQKPFESNAYQPLLKAILEAIESKNIEDPDAVWAHYHAYHVDNNLDNENYYHFKELNSYLDTHRLVLSEYDLKQLHTIARNFCIKNQNEGKLDFMEKLFEYYKLADREGFLLENGILPVRTFRNVVLIALKSGDKEWAKKFIDTKKAFLPNIVNNENSEDIAVVIVCNAWWYYGNNEPDEALKILNNNKDFLYGADYQDNCLTRTLKICIFYDSLHEFDNLEKSISNFEQYIREYEDNNSKLSVRYKNFIRFVKRLNALTEEKKLKLKLKIEISKTEPLAQKDWLLSKL